MDFCDKCAPLAEKVKIEAAEVAKREFQETLKKFSETKVEKDRMEAAAADADKRAQDAEAKLAEANAKLAEAEKDKKESLAAAAADKKFLERKDRYPEDKYDEVRRILLKMELGQFNPQDALSLADWQVAPKGKDEDETPEKPSLELAGAPSDERWDKYQMKSDDEIDAIFAKHGIIPQKGGK